MKQLATLLLSILISANVSGATPIDVCLVCSRYANDSGRVVLYFAPQSHTAISGITTTLEFGGNKYEQAFPDVLIWAYATYGTLLQLDAPVTGTVGESVPYTVTVTADDSEATTLQGEMHFVERLQGQRHILVEEGTGSWCGNCVRGMVGLSELQKTYPDSFVGCAVHYNDPMQIGDYITPLMDGGFVTAFPMATVNRNAAKALDPYYGVATPAEASNISAFEAALQESMIATLDTKAEYSNLMETVHVTCTSRFVYMEPGHEYRYGFAIVEDSVHRPDARGYNQANTLSGQASGGIWEKWEALPSVIPASEMWFNEVARSITAFDGIEGSLPALLETGRDYSFEYDVPFPTNLLEARQLKVIAMLLDATTGEVLNVTETPFSQIASGVLMPPFYTGFKWGYLPEGLQTYDLDQQQPYPTMPIAKGDGWKPWYDETEDNWLLLSTSYYNGVGRSDDWAVMPSVSVPDDSAISLTWRTRSTSATNPDGFEVYVSTTADEPNDFLKEAPLLTVDAESTEWTEHCLDLTAYAGQTVRVAFRNHTNDGELLHLDDVKVATRNPDNDGSQTGISVVDVNLAPLPTRFYTLDGKSVEGKPVQPGVYVAGGKKIYVR